MSLEDKFLFCSVPLEGNFPLSSSYALSRDLFPERSGRRLFSDLCCDFGLLDKRTG
jgi:hypothetical protein